MEIVNDITAVQFAMFALVSATYLIVCLVLPWIPGARNALGHFHSCTTLWMFSGLSFGSVFGTTLIMSVALITFMLYVEVSVLSLYIYFPLGLFLFGLGGVCSVNMTAEAVVLRARRAGVYPQFGDQKRTDSPMSLIGMKISDDEESDKSIISPTFKRAPIIRALVTKKDDTLHRGLRPFVPRGWM